MICFVNVRVAVTIWLGRLGQPSLEQKQRQNVIADILLYVYTRKNLRMPIDKTNK